MGVRHTETCIKILNRQKSDEAAFRNAVKLLFTQQAEAGVFPADVIAAHSGVLIPWNSGEQSEKGRIRRDPITGKPYKCIEPLSAKAKSKPKPPSQLPENWEPITIDG
ncbi:MAG: hypothetical protein FWE91_11935 [Defluviitaleaceae bacterium]|nr:hypothetical protein [Defluviitaleaceae bacterium]